MARWVKVFATKSDDSLVLGVHTAEGEWIPGSVHPGSHSPPQKKKKIKYN